MDLRSPLQVKELEDKEKIIFEKNPFKMTSWTVRKIRWSITLSITWTWVGGAKNANETGLYNKPNT